MEGRWGFFTRGGSLGGGTAIPDPLVSLYASAVRPGLWERLYTSLQTNDIRFEMIFVGDQPPIRSLPENIHYIYSEVKPAQCYDIACRYAAGELIMEIADDIVFSERALDILYKAFCDEGDENVVLSPRYAYNQELYGKERHAYFEGDRNAPIMPVCGLMKKSTWLRLGGIDNRFVAQCWDMDVIMRLYAIGGKVLLCDDALVTELTTAEGTDRSDLFREVGLPVDRAFLNSLWVKKHEEASLLNDAIHCVNRERGILMKSRLSPLIPLTDKDILIKSQGTRGRWR